ncbi:DUF1624 domain-containing protein [Agreia pratensis]|uniref:heparan-alpha-glucosaminide N-acetyltransferase domain-containing protein n=1 Tax=Agreia pratensis TaxID=150121 RepID=UPI00188A66B4|nr:heparan-alpha-glucosaminide N-acetyltransferase domain-containing protein [Agreia pratensis]MBF4632818.1 DUF1624 domain-containing protein [Agreia pratensis]
MTSVASRGSRIRHSYGNRIIGLDFARLLAILGMIAAHVFLGKAPEVVLIAVTGFPAALFAVLGGVSAVVSTRTMVGQGRIVAGCASVVIRGLVILSIGLVLGLLPNFIVMVLAYYGAALVVTGLLLWVPTWAVTVLATGLVIASPYLILLVRGATTPDPIAVPSLDSPISFLQTIGFTGFYPAITWLTYMLIGVCVGRCLTAEHPSTPRALRVAVVGAGLAAVGIASDLMSRAMTIAQLRHDGHSLSEAHKLVTSEGFGTPLSDGWIALLNGATHTGSSADILRTAGIAVVIIGLLVAATAQVKTPLPQPLEAFRRAGAAPLTIYVLQFGSVPILLIGASFLLPENEWLPIIKIGTLLAHIVLIIAFGWILSRSNRRGPLEALVSATVKTVVRPRRILSTAPDVGGSDEGDSASANEARTL